MKVKMIRQNIGYVLLGCCLFLARQACALSVFEDAQAIFAKAEDGASELVEVAERKFSALLVEEPGNPVYQAYHASAAALLANETFVPWKKIAQVKKGLAELDAMLKGLDRQHEERQLRGVPLALEAKLVAAGTFITVPGVFGKFDEGSRLLDDIQKKSSYSATPAEFKAAVLFRVAQMHGELGHDVQRLQSIRHALEFDPVLSASVRAKQLLQP